VTLTQTVVTRSKIMATTRLVAVPMDPLGTLVFLLLFHEEGNPGNSE
jgi:hypothetical protein